jgi:hypothetical protein
MLPITNKMLELINLMLTYSNIIVKTQFHLLEFWGMKVWTQQSY